MSIREVTIYYSNYTEVLRHKVIAKKGRRPNSTADETVYTSIEFYEDAFEACFEPGKAAVLRARANVLRALLIRLSDLKGTRHEKARLLRITPARFDLLLTSESISAFSLSELIKFAVRVGLSPKIHVELASGTLDKSVARLRAVAKLAKNDA